MKPSRYSVNILHTYVDGLVQERRNSSAFVAELGHSCINPTILELYDALVMSSVYYAAGNAIYLSQVRINE